MFMPSSLISSKEDVDVIFGPRWAPSLPIKQPQCNLGHPGYRSV